MLFKALGKISKIDYETDEVTIKYSFLTQEQRAILEDYIKENKTIEHKFNHRFKRSKTHAQQRAWYGSLALILKAKEILPSAEAMHDEDEEQRKSIFPVTLKKNCRGRTDFRPKRMHECSFSEMQKNIEKLHERHKHLKINNEFIDFSELKLK